MSRIAYIIEDMYNSGGMERVLSVCANALCNDIDVTIITLKQGDRNYYYKLSKKVYIHDLNIKSFTNGKEITSKLSKFLIERRFDTVISLGGIDFYYLHKIKDGSKKMVWFHFAFNVSIGAWLGESPSTIQKIKGCLQLVKRIHFARQYDMVVAISNTDCMSWKKYVKNVTRIPNPITINISNTSNLSAKAVISVGRLDIQKGFTYLIDAWKLVAKKHPDWELNIYGEGELRYQLQRQIDYLQLHNKINLCGANNNIVSKYIEHSIYVSSSITEAFPLVLLEASACGLPLVAFDCPSGPRDIINNGTNGFLIKRVGDIEGMASAICTLIEVKDLRQEMGEKAREMSRKFSLYSIKKRWINILN